jgi:hypothetical protein
LQHYLVAPAQIHVLRFLVEAYEGLAVVSTIDPRSGLVALSIAPGCEADLDELLGELALGIAVHPTG